MPVIPYASSTHSPVERLSPLGLNVRIGRQPADVHPQSAEWMRRLDEQRRARPIRPDLQTTPNMPPQRGTRDSPNKTQGSIAVVNGVRPSLSRQNSQSQPSTPIAGTIPKPVERSSSIPPRPATPIAGTIPKPVERSPSIPPRPTTPLAGTIPKPVERSPSIPPPPLSNDAPSEPCTPNEMTQPPSAPSIPFPELSEKINGSELEMAVGPTGDRTKRRAALIEFSEVLQTVIVAQTKLDIAQNIVKRAGPLYTATDTPVDSDLIRDIYRDESNAKAELKAAHERFEASYDSLILYSAFNENAEYLLGTAMARAGQTARDAGADEKASTTQNAIDVLQTKAETLQAALDAIEGQLKVHFANSKAVPPLDAAEVIAIVSAEFDRRQADVTMSEAIPPSTQPKSAPPSQSPSPPATAQANASMPRGSDAASETLKHGRARQMLLALIERVDTLETEQSISTSQIEEVRDSLNDLMFDCASASKSVLKRIMRGDGSDRSREMLAVELRNIIRLVSGENKVYSGTAPAESAESAAASIASLVDGSLERLKAELQTSLRAEFRAEIQAELSASITKAEITKAELMAELKTQLKAELSASITKAEITKAELMAEVKTQLKAELSASITKAEITKAELMAEVKTQLKEELKEETKAEMRAEVQQEYNTLITELQEKVEFLETGLSSQISFMYQEFREYRDGRG